MRLPPDIMKRVAGEFRFAADKMRDAKEPVRKVFFFSALHNEASRVLNEYWDRDLVLIHAVLIMTHSNLAARTQNPAIVAVLEPLTQAANDLAIYIETNGKGPSNLMDLLGRIAELNYAATGHGLYVVEKGFIKL